MEILSSSKEDRECIGGLPDSFIHRIISFSPSRKDITDGYKSWRNKWTDVAILNFVSNEKLCIDSKDIPLLYLDPKLSLWIWLAARKGARNRVEQNEELEIQYLVLEDCYEKPESLYLITKSLL
ncbi:hypothetical protein M5689_005759 [Euphorbia peplus]|nr:hypothetical protein M5689_005759 [Euphorbia peplus]